MNNLISFSGFSASRNKSWLIMKSADSSSICSRTAFQYRIALTLLRIKSQVKVRENLGKQMKNYKRIREFKMTSTASFTQLYVDYVPNAHISNNFSLGEERL